MNESEKQSILHKELDIIQGCISRMAQNSFMIKGWYFGIILIISAWKFDHEYNYVSVMAVTTLTFYTINLQFYIYERKFRDLYDQRVKIRCENNDYTTDLYKISFMNNEKNIKEEFKEYVLYNKMLIFLYSGTGVILIMAKIFLKM